MPIKGDVKKDFIRLREQVKHSVMESAKFLVEQTLAAARRDGIIVREHSTVEVFKKRGGSVLIYREIPEANVFSNHPFFGKKISKAVKNPKSKVGKRVFHYSKFISRKGNLLKALTPAGPWWGDKLEMMGMGHAEVEETATGARGTIVIDGKPAIALMAASANKEVVHITDRYGNLIGDKNIRRRIMENAIRSVVGLWNNRLKKDLDKIAREFL